MDQSSSHAAGLSCPDRGCAAEEGAASATRVKSGPRSWELEDMRGTCGETRIHPGPFQGAEQKLSVTFRRPRSNFLTHGLDDLSDEAGAAAHGCRESLRFLHGPERIQVSEQVQRDASGEHRPGGEEKQIVERREILSIGRERRDRVE